MSRARVIIGMREIVGLFTTRMEKSFCVDYGVDFASYGHDEERARLDCMEYNLNLRIIEAKQEELCNLKQANVDLINEAKRKQI